MMGEPPALPDPTWLALISLLQVAASFLPPRASPAPTAKQDLSDFNCFAHIEEEDAWRAIDQLAGSWPVNSNGQQVDSSEAQRQLRSVLERIWFLEGSRPV